MKKVIFVGGTAYSGSTFFDMTLANDPKGFSLGEVYALFYPFRKKHLDLDALGNDIDWLAIKKDGPENLYKNIFDMFPEIEFIVDSSKFPLWINERSSELRRSGIDVRNVLIWKTPAEFRKSMLKRGRKWNWVMAWINYFQYYMAMVDSWRSVRYSDFAQNRESLEQLCNILGISYFKGKEKFWEKKHSTLYGNTSAKIHLYDKDSSEYGLHQGNIKKRVSYEVQVRDSDIDSKHKKIYYDKNAAVQDDYLEHQSRFKQYIEILEYGDIHNKDFDIEAMRQLISPITPSEAYKLYQKIKLKYMGHITNKF